MARRNIQGISIEIGGDTSKLQSALKGVDKQLKDTQASLKDVDRLLKLDPGNVELLTQKQKLLGEAIGGTEDRLKTLRDAAEQANQQLADGTISQSEYDALQREILDTEQQLKSLTNQMKEFGSVSAQQIAAAGEKLKAVGDKIGDVGSNMTKYVTAPIAAVGTASAAAFGEVDDGLDIIIKKTGASGEALEDMQNRAKNLATSIPTDFSAAGAAIGEVNTRFDLTGDALEALSGRFIKFAQLNNTDVSGSIDSVQAAMAAFNMDASGAADVLDLLNKAAQDTGSDINKLSSDLTSNAAVLQEMGFSFNSATGFMANLNKNGLDSSTVLTGMKKAMQNATKDGKSMSRALDELQGSIASASNNTEAMQAATELFGSKAAPALVNAIQDGRLSFDWLSNTMRSWADSVDSTFEATLDPVDEFKTSLNELKIVGADLVKAAAPIIKQLAEGLKNVIANLRAAWEGLSPTAQQTIIKLAGIAAAVGPVLLAVGKLIAIIGSVVTLVPKLLSVVGAVKGALSGLWAVLAANPIGLAVAAIAALVAGFAVLWNKSEAFRAFWIDLLSAVKAALADAGQFLAQCWQNIVGTVTRLSEGLRDGLASIWDGVKGKVESVWDGITGFIKGVVDKIKGFFEFRWELPKIKLPHFSIQGSFSLNPPSVPRLAVDWYRKAMDDGMILTSPTIFGAQNGRLLGGGDAGPEAVVGVDSLRGMIAEAVASAASKGGARSITIPLILDRTELARAVYQLNNEETRRAGVKLTTAPTPM